MTIRILDYIEWTDPIPSLENVLIPHSKHWLRSDIIPEPKQIRLISIPYYYYVNNEIDEGKYIFYKPALSSINGYDEDYIDEINDFHIVDADISEIACELSDYNDNRRVWYLIEINQVFNFQDF